MSDSTSTFGESSSHRCAQCAEAKAALDKLLGANRRLQNVRDELVRDLLARDQVLEDLRVGSTDWATRDRCAYELGRP